MKTIPLAVARTLLRRQTTRRRTLPRRTSSVVTDKVIMLFACASCPRSNPS